MRILRSILCFTLLSTATITQASLDLELTQGVSSAIPIAIVPFQGEEAISGATLTSIVGTDLRNSGRFRVLGSQDFKFRPSSVSQVSPKNWRPMNIDSLVVGRVKKLATGQFKVDVDLVDLFGSKQQQKVTALLSKTYTINPGQLRVLAHRISDSLYQKLTGKPGVFSTHIAYVLEQRAAKKRTYQLMVADADGYNPQPLLTSHEPIMSPAWSHDGQYVAYVSFEHHRAAVYRQHVEDGRREMITGYAGINGAPAFSPDGQTMAVVLSKSGYPKIYLVDVKTKALTQVTKGWSIDTEPSFSPDGKTLIFTSNRSGGPQIYQADLTSHQIKRLTYDGRYNASARFTPDGNAIVLLHHEEGLFRVAKQAINGRLDILTDSGRDQSPSVAPNGEMILFATRFGSRQVLGMVSSDAKIHLRLPAQSGEVRDPAWSPV